MPDSTPSPVSLDKKQALDPDRFTRIAKQTVVDNFNRHRRNQKIRPLQMNQVYIVWFCKTLMNWKAMVASDNVPGKYWEVTYDGNAKAVYLDVYSKISNVEIKVGAQS